MQAGIPVEVCHVTEEGEGSSKKPKGKQNVSEVQRKRKREPKKEVDSDSEAQLNWSQLDITPKDDDFMRDVKPLTIQRSPQTPRKARQVVEVVMTQPSPHKRPRLSPEY